VSSSCRVVQSFCDCTSNRQLALHLPSFEVRMRVQLVTASEARVTSAAASVHCTVVTVMAHAQQPATTAVARDRRDVLAVRHCKSTVRLLTPGDPHQNDPLGPTLPPINALPGQLAHWTVLTLGRNNESRGLVQQPLKHSSSTAFSPSAQL
jgi:hypothetical protein